MEPPSDQPVRATYQGREGPKRRSLIPRAVVFLVFGLFALLPAEGLRSAALLGTEAFDVLGMCCALYDGIRQASLAWRLDLTADSLRWRSMFRNGEISLTDLQRMRRRWDGVGVIESTARRRLLVDASDRLWGFASDVKEAAPHIDVSFPQRNGPRRASWDHRTTRKT
jgi:hypothetical protein